jgi:hypothetical protein
LLKGQSLDELLDGDQHATFHDAVVLSIHVDYTATLFLAELDICVGDPDAPDEPARERRRRGRLAIEGLKLWALEPPSPPTLEGSRGLWLSADGPLVESPTDTGKALARAFGTQSVSWFLYFNNLNAFGYVAGDRATFAWL